MLLSYSLGDVDVVLRTLAEHLELLVFGLWSCSAVTTERSMSEYCGTIMIQIMELWCHTAECVSLLTDFSNREELDHQVLQLKDIQDAHDIGTDLVIQFVQYRHEL